MNFQEITVLNYPEVARIYLEGIATGMATFETQAPDWAQWDASHLPHSRLALYDGDVMVGWAALTAVSGRCVYAGVAEVSVYVSMEFRGRGYGSMLLNELIHSSERQGIWTLQDGIFEENTSSRRLHAHCGFRHIGHRERIGQLQGVWKNNVLMERRSETVGVN